MTTREINVVLQAFGETPKSVAEAINEDESQVSATINYLRKNQRVREKIAAHFGRTVDQMFGDEGKPPLGRREREVASSS